MDKRKSVLNISVSIISRIILLVMALYVRRLITHYIGNEVNGLNSLYSSIIGMLSAAEVGVGSAIVFSMYKPIIRGNKKQITALYCLYRKLYRIIGFVIFAAGLLVTPFLPFLISDYERLSVNVYLTFFLTLVSVVLSYLYSGKTSLIEAHKNNYITTGILTISRIVRFSLQIAVIRIRRSYPEYLICQIIETLLIWILTEAVVRRKHGDIIVSYESVEPDLKSEVVRNIKAMAIHKISAIMVNSIDSLIISGYIGVALLGKYSNYTLIAGVLSGMIGLFFSPLTSVVGHLCASGATERTKRSFNRFYCLNYVLALIFFLGYYAVIDDAIALCFGDGLEVPRAVTFFITLNQFTSFMRKTSLLFRDASGTFYHDRWKPLVEGIINLVLSIMFVNMFPGDYRVAGVIAATVITTLCICHVVEPIIVFKYLFKEPPRTYMIRNYAYTALFVCCVVLMSYLIRPCSSNIEGILLNGTLSIILSVSALGLLAAADKGFRTELQMLINTVTEWFSNVFSRFNRSAR